MPTAPIHCSHHKIQQYLSLMYAVQNQADDDMLCNCYKTTK